MAMHKASIWVGVGLLALAPSAVLAGGNQFVGKQAPEISLSNTLNHDGPLSLKAARGRVVLLEFWATWCPPCRRTIPHLQKIYKQYRSKGLSVISISSEQRRVVSRFVRKQGSKMTYPIGIDNNRRTGSTYGIRGIPSAFLIDPSGKVIWQGHPLALQEDTIVESLKGVDPKVLAKGAGKTLSIFHLKNGNTIEGYRLGVMGKVTLIKTKDGNKVRIPTADIVKTTTTGEKPEGKQKAK